MIRRIELARPARPRPSSLRSSLAGDLPDLSRDPLRADHQPDLRGAAAVPAAPRHARGPRRGRSTFTTEDGLRLAGTYLRAADRAARRASSSSATST